MFVNKIIDKMCSIACNGKNPESSCKVNINVKVVTLPELNMVC